MVEEKLEPTKRRLLMVEEELESTKQSLLMVVEELESTKRTLLTANNMTTQGRNETAGSSMKLQFRGKICRTILTGEEIKGEGNACIEVVLVDDATNNIVETEPESSLTLEIVLLQGDSEVSEFNEKIVPEIEGKKPLLAGNLCLELHQGVAILDSIKFRHHTTKIKPSVFRLGARVLDNAYVCAHVKEAETEPFTVKDFRYKYYKKQKFPALTDKVSRLINIRKGGPIDKRLQADKVSTVEDFLIRLLIDPQGLKYIVNLGAKKWDVTLKNARACRSDKRTYCYTNSQLNKAVVFNVLGQVLGLHSGNLYFPTDLLPETHKADAQEMLATAYEHWEETIHFDDENSLKQHLNSLRTSVSDPQIEPYYSLGGHDFLIGESSKSRSNSSSFGSTLSSYDMEIIHDAAPMQHSPFNPDIMFEDFDDYLNQNSTHAITKPSKRWRTLFWCVKMVLHKKLVSVGDNPCPKRQRAC